jgi:hypothetical protein
MSGTRVFPITSRRELSSSPPPLPLQGKEPKEIHIILTETLACFLPGRAKDISPPLQERKMFHTNAFPALQALSLSLQVSGIINVANVLHLLHCGFICLLKDYSRWLHNYHLIIIGPVTAYTNRMAPNNALLSNLRWQVYSSRISKVPLSCSWYTVNLIRLAC